MLNKYLIVKEDRELEYTEHYKLSIKENIKILDKTKDLGDNWILFKCKPSSIKNTGDNFKININNKNITLNYSEAFELFILLFQEYKTSRILEINIESINQLK